MKIKLISHKVILHRQTDRDDWRECDRFCDEESHEHVEAIFFTAEVEEAK